MQLVRNFKTPSLLLRSFLALGYLWAIADRFGLFGTHGQPGITWGDWPHFMNSAKMIMSFLPQFIIQPFAIIATVGELVFGILLLIGLFTRFAAVGSAILTLLFAISMTISFGLHAPVSYSVFVVSAASLLLATIPYYAFSIDSLLLKNKKPLI
jgi:putative oxidoreductase